MQRTKLKVAEKEAEATQKQIFLVQKQTDVEKQCTENLDRELLVQRERKEANLAGYLMFSRSAPSSGSVPLLDPTCATNPNIDCCD